MIRGRREANYLQIALLGLALAGLPGCVQPDRRADEQEAWRKIQQLLDARAELDQSAAAPEAKKQRALEFDREIKLLAPRLKTHKANLGTQAELAGFEYRLIGEQRYRMYFVFQSKEKFDRDYNLLVYGNLDASQRDQLSATGDVWKDFDKYFENWSFTLIDPLTGKGTKDWESGKYYAYYHDVTARPIPYRIEVHFYWWDDGNAPAGVKHWVNLGWYVDF